MILWEIKETLKKLLEEKQEKIHITDSDSYFAEDIVHELGNLFQSLKCDYRITRVSQNSFEVVLFN